MVQNNLYEQVRNWIYRNARPLDFARWQYHFEGGSQEQVITILESYQNEDGGFGHALEADAWNPYSSPIQTFHALEILRELHFTDGSHKVIQGVLRYLASGQDMEGDIWLNNVQSNNDYPSAPWWKVGDESSGHNPYNPTAGLAGFALCYGERDSELFETCARIARDGVKYLLQVEEIDMHVLICFIALMEYCEQAQITDIIDLAAMKQKLMELVQKAITKDTDVWSTTYCCKPSQFFNNPDSIFYPGMQEIADYESEFIKETRNEDGVWNITWGWDSYPEEWAITKNWWKSELVIKNMRILKNYRLL
ncbi:MAG: hypothetical protein K0R46_2397 [Herbinix sp.]|jgi:hypothetical protein|nr:hypothetical protein [Herbinix sp.]